VFPRPFFFGFSSVIKFNNRLLFFRSELEVNYFLFEEINCCYSFTYMHFQHFAVANVSTMSLNDIKIIVKQGRKMLEADGSRHCGFQMTDDLATSQGSRSTGNNEYVEQF